MKSRELFIYVCIFQVLLLTARVPIYAWDQAGQQDTGAPQDSTDREVPDNLKYVTLSTFELMPQFNPWLKTTNPAGLRFNPDVDPGKLSLNYQGEAGDYKRVQQGEKLNQYSLQTGRFQRIKRTYLYGDFTYNKSFEKFTKYTNVDDPYRGTPYLLIDPTGTADTYDREYFTMRGDISTPLFKNLAWGMSADMKVGLSSQDRDPRPRNKVLNLALSTGLILSYDHASIGANFLYSYYNEDIEVEIIEQNVQMAFLQLHGFDTYTYHVAASFNRLYLRNTIGGEGQFNLSFGKLNTLFAGKFLYINEVANDGRKAGDASWSYIKNDSELKGNEIEISNATTYRHGNFLHTLHAAYKQRYMVGTEIIQRLEQVGDAGAVDWVEYGREEKYSSAIHDLTFNYSFLILKHTYARNLEVNIGLNYLGSEQAYFVPDMADSYRNRILYASAGKSFFAGKSEFSIGAGIKMKKNLESSKDFDETSFISTILLLPDFHYLTSDYIAPSVNIAYAVKLNKLFDKYFLSSNISFYKGSDETDRTIFNISTGFIFKN